MISVQSMLLEKVNEKLPNSEKTRKRMVATWPFSTRKVVLVSPASHLRTFLVAAILLRVFFGILQSFIHLFKKH